MNFSGVKMCYILFAYNGHILFAPCIVVVIFSVGNKLIYYWSSIQGSDHTMSLDGHDKLCGFQKSMFPLCIYGGLDTFSGRMNILRIWTTNNKPELVGRFYFEYLYEHRGKQI